MTSEKGLKRLAATWALRAIFHPKVLKRFNIGNHWSDEDILKLVGLEELVDTRLSKRELKRRFASELDKIEREQLDRSEPFFENIDQLAQGINLNPVEKEILVFSLVLHQDDGLRVAVDCLGNLNVSTLSDHLSAILKLDRDETREALGRRNGLCSSGLLSVCRTRELEMSHCLQPLDGLYGVLQESRGDLESMLFTYFHKAAGPRLSRSDFLHLDQDLSILYPYIKGARQLKLPGVNVLFYGPPGTGKTELARTIGEELDLRLYEVSCENEDGDPADENRRFKSYSLCQHLFARRRDCLILFDEIEDVFPMLSYGFFGTVRKSGVHKGWTNRMLESNPVPTIWISNSIDHIDSAFLRRFDFVFEVPVPPRAVRKSVIANIVSGLPLGSEWLEKTADNESLAPSQIEKAARVATLASTREPKALESVFDRVIGNAQKAMGLLERSVYREAKADNYDVKYVNADRNLGALIEAFRRNASARVCLYGPPGSGKTAYVHHVGKILGKRVLVRRASNILQPYLGQTEHQIALMFSQAREQEAVLLLDEADSFLRDRSRAHHSWEITQVNELLVQMEAYEGLFFCATNLMDLLDSAVFRRFDLRIKLDYLTRTQICSLLEKTLQGFGHQVSKDEIGRCNSHLASLARLTPGDFEAVRRRLKLMGTKIDTEIFVQELANEIITKPGARKRAPGFIRVI